MGWPVFGSVCVVFAVSLVAASTTTSPVAASNTEASLTFVPNGRFESEVPETVERVKTGSGSSALVVR